MSVAVAVGYEFASSHDQTWGGFCQRLEEAQQECQAVTDDAFHWALVDEGMWAARDSTSGALYQIECRPL